MGDMTFNAKVSSPFYAKVAKAYIIDYETQEKIELQFNPKEWYDERSVNYAEHNIPGISHPVLQFTNGGDRIFKADIHMNSMFDENAPYIAHWIRARTYPERSENILLNAPHRVVFVYPNSMWILGVIIEANRHVLDTFPDGRIKIMDLSITIKEKIWCNVNMSDVYNPLS